jgi:CHASE2 domain-containing sensor protein
LALSTTFKENEMSASFAAQHETPEYLHTMHAQVEDLALGMDVLSYTLGFTGTLITSVLAFSASTFWVGVLITLIGAVLITLLSALLVIYAGVRHTGRVQALGTASRKGWNKARGLFAHVTKS